MKLHGWTIQHLRHEELFIDRKGVVRDWPWLFNKREHAEEAFRGLVDAKTTAFVPQDWGLSPIEILIGKSQ